MEVTDSAFPASFSSVNKPFIGVKELILL